MPDAQGMAAALYSFGIVLALHGIGQAWLLDPSFGLCSEGGFRFSS
jgi:hypothetical protein